MRQATLYLTLADDDDFEILLKECFPGWRLSREAGARSFTVAKRKFFRQRKIVFSLKSLAKDGDIFQAMRLDLRDFFAAVDTEREKVKNKLLAQIMVFTAVVGVVADHDLEAQTMNALTEITDRGHGLVLLPPGTWLDGQGRLVFDLDGESELKEHVVEAPAELLDRWVVVTESGEKRRARSLAALAEKGIPTAKTLPPIVGDENYVPRGREEIAGRTLAILITSVYAELLPQGGSQARATAADLLKQYSCAQFLSPAERAFLGDPEPDQQLVVNFTWRYECAWVGLWALGLVEELSYPDGICDVGAMAGLVRDLGDRAAVLEKSTPREPSEILDEADLIYRYDWACVDARIKGRAAPAGLDSGVVVERHRMFNWLIRYLEADWDDISTDT